MSSCGDNFTPSPANVSACKDHTTAATSTEIDANMPLILSNMGIPACKYQGTGSIIKSSTLSDKSFVSSLPCEQVATITSKYMETKKIINCVVSHVANCSSQNIAIAQNISIHNMPGGVIDCSCSGPQCTDSAGLTISQSAVVNSVHSTQFRNVYDALGSSVTDLAKTMFVEMKPSSGQNNSNNFLSSPAAQNRVAALSADIDVELSSKDWSSVVNKAIQDIYISQGISIVNYGLIKGNDCTISQSTVANIVADHIISNGVAEAFEIPQVKKFIEEMNASDVQEFPIVDNMVAIIIGSVVGGLVLLGLIIFLVVFFGKKS